MQPSEQVTAQVTAQVPPGTVRDDGERALVQALADQVLDSIRVAPRRGAWIETTLEAARQAVARLPVANSIRAAVYRTVQTTVVNDTLQEHR